MERKKLVFRRETVKALTRGELQRALGAATTKGDSGGCSAQPSTCSTRLEQTHCGCSNGDFSCDVSGGIPCNSEGFRCW